TSCLGLVPSLVSSWQLCDIDPITQYWAPTGLIMGPILIIRKSFGPAIWVRSRTRNCWVTSRTGRSGLSSRTRPQPECRHSNISKKHTNQGQLSLCCEPQTMKLTNDHVNPLSMERIVPDDLLSDETTGAETLRFHLERYQFARQYLVQGSVLDIACGVGYGTALLAEHPEVTKALGVDISFASVQYALQRYNGDRVSYICS